MIGVYLFLLTLGMREPEIQSRAIAETSRDVSELLQEAEDTTRKITETGQRAAALLEIAVVHSRAGNRATAHTLVLESIQTAQSLGDSAGAGRDELLAVAAARQAELADILGALKTIQAIQGAGVRDYARTLVVEALLMRAEHKIAVNICDSIERAVVRDLVFSSIAESMARNVHLEDALAIVTRVEDASSRLVTLLLVALAQVASLPANRIW